MQRALVVYESMFGNTEAVARAVASGLESRGSRVTLRSVSEVSAADIGQYDVVVAGAPTHVFGLSRPASRADAVRQGADATRAETGLREWIEGIDPAVAPRTRFAVFDTRVGRGRRVTGSAARGAARVLCRRHRRLADDPASFYVGGSCGPLLPGEEIRARAWGSRLAQACRSPAR